MNDTSKNHSVLELIKELKSSVVALRNDPKVTSQLELDLMKEKIRSIYDILCTIKIEKAIEQTIEKKNILQAESEFSPEVEKEPPPKAVPELALDIENDVDGEIEDTVSSELKEEIQPQSSEPILNLFEENIESTGDNEKKSVGEKIAEEKPIESIGDVIQSKKIISLKLAIGINEKFFFLNELFDGKMNDYNDAIEKLDQKETFKDAMEYFVLLRQDKSWNEDSEAHNQLKEFLERKFN